MLRIWKMFVLLSGICSSLVAYSEGNDCRNEWSHPSHQTMRMDSATSFALTEYKNGDRYFSVKQSTGESVEIYYLKDTVLVKGHGKEPSEVLTQAQIEQSFHHELFWLPMVFVVPISILAEAAPNGPCNIEEKTPISIQLSGGLGLQDRKLTGATGQLLSLTPSESSYELDVSIDPPDPNKTSVRYLGAMSFAPQQKSPPDDTDITDFSIVTGSRPYPVAGNSGIPATFGELRRFLTSRQTK